MSINTTTAPPLTSIYGTTTDVLNLHLQNAVISLLNYLPSLLPPFLHFKSWLSLSSLGTTTLFCWPTPSSSAMLIYFSGLWISSKAATVTKCTLAMLYPGFQVLHVWVHALLDSVICTASCCCRWMNWGWQWVWRINWRKQRNEVDKKTERWNG